MKFVSESLFIHQQYRVFECSPLLSLITDTLFSIEMPFDGKQLCAYKLPIGKIKQEKNYIK